MKILYLAKEPDQGVKSDLAELSQLGEVTVVACNPGYVDFYKKIGYNVISKGVFFDELDMKFDYIIGNPPYQSVAENKEGGLRGSKKNLYSSFIKKGIELLVDGGTLNLICPPGYLKTTSLDEEYELFSLMKKYNLVSVNFDCKKYFPSVGLPVITNFVLKKDTNYQGTRFITSSTDEIIDISSMKYIPINCSKEVLNRLNEVLSDTPNYSFKRDDFYKKVNSYKNYVAISQIGSGPLDVYVNEIPVNKKGKRKPIHVMKCDSLSHAEEVYVAMTSDEATYLNSTLRYGDANVYPNIINYLKKDNA